MEIPDRLLCLFTEQIEEQDGSYIIEIPDQEPTHENVREGETYRVAILSTEPEPERTATDSRQERDHEAPEPPVEQGETREVEIEDIGEQGDGITRVERGYVVIVPDTKPSERVRIEITDVRENVGFAEVVERLSYYE